MKHVLLTVVTLAAAACAPAPSTPTRSAAPSRAEPPASARKLEGTWSARHWRDSVEECGGRCTFRTQSYSTVGLELLPNGAARLVNDGRMVERFDAQSGKRAHMTEWNRSWAGSWSEGGDQLQLKLEDVGRSCERTSDSGQKEPLCEPMSLTLQCERMRIALVDKKAKSPWAWVCDGNVAPRVGLTPMPWVFGEEGVLVAVDTGKNRPAERRYMHTRRPELAKKSNDFQ